MLFTGGLGSSAAFQGKRIPVFLDKGSIMQERQAGAVLRESTGWTPVNA
jgi:hypothetical protein